MANPEQYHSSPAEKIQGDFADIDLVSSAQWLQFFESQTQYERIYDGDSDSLPDPFHGATISAGMVGAHFKEVLNMIRRQRLFEFDETGTMLPIRHADILREIKAFDIES